MSANIQPPRFFRRLWATLLLGLFCSSTLLPAWQQIGQMSSKMACCRNGKVHSCCTRQKPASDPAFVSQPGCASRCSPSVASPFQAFAAMLDPTGAQRTLAAPAPTPALPDPPHPRDSRFDHHLLPRPPPPTA